MNRSRSPSASRPRRCAAPTRRCAAWTRWAPAPPARQGPPAASLSTYATFIHDIPFGGEVDLASNGPLRYFARCIQDAGGGNSALRIFVVSTVATAFSTDSGPAPLVVDSENEVLSLVFNGASVGFDNAVDDDAAVARDGVNRYYLAIQRETTALGINAFGPGCSIAGTSFQTTTPVVP